MQTIPLIKTSDVPSGTMKSVLAADKKILLANVDGVFHAMTSVCPHMGADLSTGTLQGTIVICPAHKAAFDVTDGRAVDAATGGPPTIKRKNALAFHVWVENDQVLVEI